MSIIHDLGGLNGSTRQLERDNEQLCQQVEIMKAARQVMLEAVMKRTEECLALHEVNQQLVVALTEARKQVPVQRAAVLMLIDNALAAAGVK